MWCSPRAVRVSETRVPRRRGHLLVEALCALALMGVLAVAAASALRRAQQTLLTTEREARAARGAREAIAIATAMVQDASQPTAVGDTAIDFRLPIATGVTCDRIAGDAVLPPESPFSSGFMSAAQRVEPGDLLRWRAVDSLTGVVAWREARIDSVFSVAAGAACPVGLYVAATDGARARTGLRLDGSASPSAGTPVRVHRPGRLVLYRSAGEWMLGWRRCAGGLCGVVQPIAGPLLSAAHGGFRVQVDSGGVGLEVRYDRTRPPLRRRIARDIDGEP